MSSLTRYQMAGRRNALTQNLNIVNDLQTISWIGLNYASYIFLYDITKYVDIFQQWVVQNEGKWSYNRKDTNITTVDDYTNKTLHKFKNQLNIRGFFNTTMCQIWSTKLYLMERVPWLKHTISCLEPMKIRVFTAVGYPFSSYKFCWL